MRELAATREPIKSIAGLVQFADGHVLVNDPLGKRFVLFDSSLSSHVVTADDPSNEDNRRWTTRNTSCMASSSCPGGTPMRCNIFQVKSAYS